MENFNDIIKSGKLTLVDFYATWCEAISTQYRIMSVPTFMLFKNGEAVWRQSGTIRLNDLKNLISQHL